MLARNLQDKSSSAALAAEHARLKQMRMLAARRQDWKEAAALDAQLAAVEEKLPAKKAERDREPSREERLAEVNRRNRAANMEAVRQAELREAERKRRERERKLLVASAAGTPRAGTPKNGLKPFSPRFVASLRLSLLSLRSSVCLSVWTGVDCAFVFAHTHSIDQAHLQPRVRRTAPRLLCHPPRRPPPQRTRARTSRRPSCSPWRSTSATFSSRWPALVRLKPDPKVRSSCSFAKPVRAMNIILCIAHVHTAPH